MVTAGASESWTALEFAISPAQVLTASRQVAVTVELLVPAVTALPALRLTASRFVGVSKLWYTSSESQKVEGPRPESGDDTGVTTGLSMGVVAGVTREPRLLLFRLEPARERTVRTASKQMIQGRGRTRGRNNGPIQDVKPSSRRACSHVGRPCDG